MALATPIIACTYAEIALKGRNRKVFLRKLINNITVALKGEPIDVGQPRGKPAPGAPGRTPAARPEVARKLQGCLRHAVAVAGGGRCRAAEVDAELREDLEAEREPRLTRLCEVATELAGRNRRRRRATSRSRPGAATAAFRLKSPEISRLVGAAVHQATGLPGKMSHPDLTVNVLVLKENVLVFTGKEPAYGRPALRLQRPGHGAAVRGHRFAGGRLADDAPRQPARLRPLLLGPQRRRSGRRTRSRSWWRSWRGIRPCR